jgi:hypothetical protein
MCFSQRPASIIDCHGCEMDRERCSYLPLRSGTHICESERRKKIVTCRGCVDCHTTTKSNFSETFQREAYRCGLMRLAQQASDQPNQGKGILLLRTRLVTAKQETRTLTVVWLRDLEPRYSAEVTLPKVTLLPICFRSVIYPSRFVSIARGAEGLNKS